MKKNPNTFGKSKMASLQQELFDSESPEQAPAPEPPLMKPTPKQMHPRAMVTAPFRSSPFGGTTTARTR